MAGGGGAEVRERPQVVIAIDGPAGAGKSTVARGVAARLSYTHVDTGAMYRALTWLALHRGVDLEEGDALLRLAGAARIRYGPSGVEAGGEPLGEAIRSPEVTAAVSAVSAHAEVRRELVRLQRAVGGAGGVVMEGRDIGTVVFPEAAVKVFLTASSGERAERRRRDLAASGVEVPLEELERQIVRRDTLDSSRAASPLRPAPDARVIDSTGRNVGDVIDEVLGLVRSVLDVEAEER